MQLQVVTVSLLSLVPKNAEGDPVLQGLAFESGHLRLAVLDGLSAVEILAQKPELSLASIHSAISYVFDHCEEIERKLADENAEYERLKQKACTKHVADGNLNQVSS